MGGTQGAACDHGAHGSLAGLLGVDAHALERDTRRNLREAHDGVEDGGAGSREGAREVVGALEARRRLALGHADLLAQAHAGLALVGVAALLLGHVLLGMGEVVLEVVRQVAEAREHLAEGLVAVAGLAHLARRVGPLQLAARLNERHLAAHDLDGLHHRVDDAHLGGLGLAARAQVARQVHREVGEVEHERGPGLGGDGTQAGHLHDRGALLGDARLDAGEVQRVGGAAGHGLGTLEQVAQVASRGLHHDDGVGGAHGGAQAAVHAEALADGHLEAAGMLGGLGDTHGLARADVDARLARGLGVGAAQAQRLILTDGAHDLFCVLACHTKLALLCHIDSSSKNDVLSSNARIIPQLEAVRSIIMVRCTLVRPKEEERCPKTHPSNTRSTPPMP